MEIHAGEIAEIHFTKKGKRMSDVDNICLHFVSKEKGWYYNLSRRTIDIKFKVPEEQQFSITVSREKFNLIGDMNN